MSTVTYFQWSFAISGSHSWVEMSFAVAFCLFLHVLQEAIYM